MKTPMKTSVKLLLGASLTVFVLLQAALWSGHGLPDLFELRSLNRTSEIENNELRERNRALAREVTGMKSGLGEIEREAREELGMVKQGETFFQVIDGAPEQPAPQ